MRTFSSFITCFLITGLGATGLPGQSQSAAGQAPDAKEELTPEKRGDIFVARKMYREAIDAFRLAKPMTPVVLNKIGIAYHQLNEIKVARQWYEKSIKMKNDYSEAINNVGTVYYAEKNYRRAVTYYKRALQYSPDSASVHSNLGTAYFARKKYEDAVVEYEIAMKLDPEVFERRSQQGTLLQERNYEERAKFHYYLSKMYAKSGNVELALQNIRKSLEEGFKERKKFLEEPEFASVRQHPDFEILMKMEPRVL